MHRRVKPKSPVPAGPAAVTRATQRFRLNSDNLPTQAHPHCLCKGKIVLAVPDAGADRAHRMCAVVSGPHGVLWAGLLSISSSRLASLRNVRFTLPWPRHVARQTNSTTHYVVHRLAPDILGDWGTGRRPRRYPDASFASRNMSFCAREVSRSPTHVIYIPSYFLLAECRIPPSPQVYGKWVPFRGILSCNPE